jgi:hypothetical protein
MTRSDDLFRALLAADPDSLELNRLKAQSLVLYVPSIFYLFVVEKLSDWFYAE